MYRLSILMSHRLAKIDARLNELEVRGCANGYAHGIRARTLNKSNALDRPCGCGDLLNWDASIEYLRRSRIAEDHCPYAIVERIYVNNIV